MSSYAGDQEGLGRDKLLGVTRPNSRFHQSIWRNKHPTNVSCFVAISSFPPKAFDSEMSIPAIPLEAGFELNAVTLRIYGISLNRNLWIFVVFSHECSANPLCFFTTFLLFQGFQSWYIESVEFVKFRFSTFKSVESIGIPHVEISKTLDTVRCSLGLSPLGA